MAGAALSPAPSAAAARPLTVVHMLHTVAYGGIETILINWARTASRERLVLHLACFATPGNTEEPFVQAAERAGLRVRRIPWGRRKPVLRAARALAAIVREEQADIVHTHNTYADLVGLLAARFTGARTVSSLYVWSDFGWKRNLLQKVNEWILRGFDLITTQCEQTRRDTIQRGLPAERTQVLVSGFEVPSGRMDAERRQAERRALGVADDHVVLANVARLYPEKAQDLLLRCFVRILERRPEARLWIFGTGPLEADLRALCHGLGLDERVRFAGFADDLEAVLPLADIQVHPSHAEGVPMALCSGMAVGLPVVASTVGGIPEIVDGGACGLLVPPAGDPRFADAFVEAVVSLIADPEARRDWGERGRRFILGHYSLQAAVRGLETTYRAVVECGSGSS